MLGFIREYLDSFRTQTPERKVATLLNQAKLDLVEAEAFLEKYKADVPMLKARIARIEAEQKIAAITAGTRPARGSIQAPAPATPREVAKPHDWASEFPAMASRRAVPAQG